MRYGPVIVYATEVTAHELDRRISEVARKGWDTEIQIRTVQRAKSVLPRGLIQTTDVESLGKQISKAWHQDKVSRVFVEKVLGVKTPNLEREGIRIRACAMASMHDELLDELDRRKLHWLSHSIHEWGKAGIRHLHPQEWRNQFASLGCEWIGEGILKQLRVISDAELLSGIVVQDQDLLGLDVAHGCVMDNEPGSSSVNVRDLLEHTYTCPVHEIDFAKQPEQFKNIDRLYIYEDGLWSGVELVKRLAQLAAWPAVRSRDLQVTFRFGATSDAGLCAGRHFLRREKLTSVDIEIGGVEHFKQLRPGAQEKLFALREATDEEVRRALDSSVQPLAFSDNSLWHGRDANALDVCREIGKQLVQPWIERTKGNYDIAECAAKWALGAFGFASVTAFSKSVPKPVLPLLWLDGAVRLNGRTVHWRPLFWDSRRTGAPPPKRN